MIAFDVNSQARLLFFTHKTHLFFFPRKTSAGASEFTGPVCDIVGQ
jgi:hypothetical protein